MFKDKKKKFKGCNHNLTILLCYGANIYDPCSVMKSSNKSVPEGYQLYDEIFAYCFWYAYIAIHPIDTFILVLHKVYFKTVYYTQVIKLTQLEVYWLMLFKIIFYNIVYFFNNSQLLFLKCRIFFNVS